MTTPAIRTAPLPADQHVLLTDYPRDDWAGHPNFKRATEQWLGAHQMFRRLSALVRSDAETYLGKNHDAADYAARLGHFGKLLVANLHGHHSWEDRSYFPELAAADPLFEAGLEVLEQDHAALDGILDTFTRQANRVIKLVQLDEAAAREEAAAVHLGATQIERLLTRHLTDEEDLAVPIILHHKLRG